jgi:glycine/D-amino acid oxidase-like deaminating enzyme
MTPDLQILIIGGGLSGLSAALHLACAGVEDLFVLEAERIGQGGNVYLPGTPGPMFPDYTKMVLTPDDRGYTYLSRRFNREVARNLLRIKRRGVELQLALAREFGPRLVRQYGTLIVGEPDDDRRLREEHRVMGDLGIETDIESYGSERHRAGQVRPGPVRHRGRDRGLHALRPGHRAHARRDPLPRTLARGGAAGGGRCGARAPRGR